MQKLHRLVEEAGARPNQGCYQICRFQASCMQKLHRLVDKTGARPKKAESTELYVGAHTPCMTLLAVRR